jgi:hypothetical protein
MTQADKTQEYVELNRRIEKQLDDAYKAQRRAFDRVYQAVHDAKEAGWSNQDIGHVLGMSEGGIRMMIKRQSKRRYYH